MEQKRGIRQQPITTYLRPKDTGVSTGLCRTHTTRSLARGGAKGGTGSERTFGCALDWLSKAHLTKLGIDSVYNVCYIVYSQVATGEINMWTQFWDMNSGGDRKEKWARVYIEAPEDEAKIIFYNRFGHNPERVTCTCCGDDYSIAEGASLARLSAFHRNCRTLKHPEDSKTGRYKNMDGDVYFEAHYYLEGDEQPAEGYEIDDRFSRGEYMTLEQYVNSSDVHVIYAEDIEDHERGGKVPTQGYVWAG